MTKVFLKLCPVTCEHDSLYLQKKRSEEFSDLLKSFPTKERLELPHGTSKDGARRNEWKVQRDRKLFLVLSQSLNVELSKAGIRCSGKSELAVASTEPLATGRVPRGEVPFPLGG